MRYIIAVILLLVSISGYSQFGYQGANSQASLIRPQQIRKTVSPGSNSLYVVATKPSLLTPSFIRIPDSSTIVSYGVDQILSKTSQGTFKLSYNFGASNFVVEGDSMPQNEIQTLSRYLLGLKMTNGLSPSTYLSLPDSSAQNEIQTLSIFANKGTIKLTNPNSASTFIQLADSTISNEGALTVGAGTASTSLIQSNTSGSSSVILQAGTGITLSETVGAGLITISSTGGTVTSVAVSGANGIGVSGSPITSSGTIALSLGSITPTSIVSSGTISGTNLSGTNTGDVTLAGENYLSIASQVITANAVNLSGTNATGILAAGRFPALTGDVTTVAGALATTIANNAVTLGKMAQVATQTFLGRTTAGTGNVEALTIAQAKAMLNLTGTNSGDQTITLTSDVTGSGTGSFATTISAGAVTLAKMANLAANSIIGNNTGSPATPIALTAAQTKTLLSLNLVENTALSTWAGSTNITSLGAITVGSWAATDIAFANIAQLPTLTLAGNSTGSTADIQAVTLGSGLTFSAGSLFATDASVTNEGILSVSAGSGTTSVINSSTFGSPSVTLTAGTGITLSENTGTSTITITSSVGGTVKHIKHGTQVYQVGLQADMSTNKDTATISLLYDNMPTVDSLLNVKSDYFAITRVIADVNNNAKLTAFNFLKGHDPRVISSTGTKNYDFDDSYNIIVFKTASAIVYKLPSSPSDGEQISFVNLRSSATYPQLDGNSKNINGSATYNFSALYEKLKIRYFSSEGQWLIIP